MHKALNLVRQYSLWTALALGVQGLCTLSLPAISQSRGDTSFSFRWTLQSTPTTASLRGLSVVSDQVAWASGSEGTCLRTTDGGTTWEIRTIPGTDSIDFRDIEAFSADEAFVLSAGEPALLYHTTDGGQTWQLRYENRTPGIFFDVLAFWDTQHGIAMSDPQWQRPGDGHFVLIATHDGGQHWEPLPTDSMPPPRRGEAGFAASGTGMATWENQQVWLATGGAQARVFRSQDQGNRWTVTETPMRQGNASQGIFSIVRMSATHGVAVGGDYQRPEDTTRTACLTTDGGQTWQLPTTFPGGYRSAVAYHPETPILLAVGPSGADYSVDQGRTWHSIAGTSSSTLGYHAVQLVPDQRVGWATGSEGRIARVRW